MQRVRVFANRPKRKPFGHAKDSHFGQLAKTKTCYVHDDESENQYDHDDDDDDDDHDRYNLYHGCHDDHGHDGDDCDDW